MVTRGQICICFIIIIIIFIIVIIIIGFFGFILKPRTKRRLLKKPFGFSAKEIFGKIKTGGDKLTILSDNILVPKKRQEVFRKDENNDR